MGENISVIDGRVVDFFFGPRVFIPATLDNTREVHNQSFEIGIDCTVKNLPSLVNGRSITFEAFVETDNEVRTQVERISPRVSMHVNVTGLVTILRSGYFQGSIKFLRISSQQGNNFHGFLLWTVSFQYLLNFQLYGIVSRVSSRILSKDFS